MAIETRIQSGKMVFGNWEVEKFIGSGSGGKTAVFSIKRKHGEWQETAAVKVINILEEVGQKELLADTYRQEYEEECAELCKQAEQELHLMSRLKGNSHIVEYYDFAFVEYQEENTFGTDLLIRMELLCSLRDERKEKGEYSEEEVIHIGKDICKGLMVCHEAGILHRDIKPANIFVTPRGDYKLGDFGIARMVDAGQKASTKMGTRAYAAPEQFMSYEENYDKRVDIYSLGLTLYELSNHNRLPFANSGYVRESEIQLRILGRELPEPENVGAAMKAVVLKACAYKPDDRFLSAEEMLEELLAAEIGVTGEDEKAKIKASNRMQSDTADKTEVREKKASHLTWIIWGGIVLLVFILIFILLFRMQSKNEKTEEPLSVTKETSDTTGEDSAVQNADHIKVIHNSWITREPNEEEYAAIFGKASEVTATKNNVAVIAENGDLYIWGKNEYGNVGCGNTEFQEKPVKVLENVAHVEMNDTNTAALTTDGEVYCWGLNTNFQVGNGGWTQEYKPVLIMRGVKQMSMGDSSCGALLENGDLYTWGNPNENGTASDQIKPVFVAGNIESFQLSLLKGGAVTKDGDLYMWGINWGGQVGIGDEEPHLTPVKVMENVATLSLSDTTTSAITKKGELYIWGENGYGQTGTGTMSRTGVFEPTFIMSHAKNVYWSPGVNQVHGAAVAETGEVYMWGANDNAQLGDAMSTRMESLIRVSNLLPGNAKELVLSENNTAVIMENGDLYLCGANNNHQINDSDLWKIKQFYKAEENIVSVAMTLDAVYAVGEDGSFYCWGD